MTAPSRVGIGAEVTSSNPADMTSLTFNDSDLPAGAVRDDRVVVALEAYVAANVAVLANPTLSDGWSFARHGVSNGGSGEGTLGLWVVTARNRPGVWPLVIDDIGEPGVNTSATGLVLAYRRSHAYTDKHANGGFSRTANPAPPSWNVFPPSWNVSSWSVPSSGFAVAMAVDIFGNITGLSTANGFSEARTGSSWRVADLVWDGSTGSPATVTPPKWSRSPAGSGNAPGVAFAVVFDHPDPLRVLGGAQTGTPTGPTAAWGIH